MILTSERLFHDTKWLTVVLERRAIDERVSPGRTVKVVFRLVNCDIVTIREPLFLNAEIRRFKAAIVLLST